jgi:hypothetical protein
MSLLIGGRRKLGRLNQSKAAQRGKQCVVIYSKYKQNVRLRAGKQNEKCCKTAHITCTEKSHSGEDSSRCRVQMRLPRDPRGAARSSASSGADRFTCRPGVQWRCRAYELYAYLLKRGLLNEYTPTDFHHLNNYIASLEKDKFYWVTQLRDIRYQESTDLRSLLPQDMLPRSSLIWPRLKLNTKANNMLLNFFGYLPNE